MALPDREGRFQAYAVRHALRYIGENKLPTLVADYQLVNELQTDGSWADIGNEGLGLTGFHYLLKKNGQLNTTTIDQIKRAFPIWDGRDLAMLDEADLSAELVQVTVAMDEWNGKVSPKVAWLTASDDESQPGLAGKDPAEAHDIINKLGAKLRAHAGSTPAKASPPKAKPAPPGKPVPKPAPPARPAAAPGKPVAPAPPKPATPDDALMLAWNAFVAACPQEWSAEDTENEFWKIVGELFPNRDLNALSIDEWLEVQEQAPGKIVPF